MPRVGWVFTGSRMLKVPTSFEEDAPLKEIYAASYEGNVVDVEIKHMEFLGSFYRAEIGGPEIGGLWEPMVLIL